MKRYVKTFSQSINEQDHKDSAVGMIDRSMDVLPKLVEQLRALLEEEKNDTSLHGSEQAKKLAAKINSWAIAWNKNEVILDTDDTP